LNDLIVETIITREQGVSIVALSTDRPLIATFGTVQDVTANELRIEVRTGSEQAFRIGSKMPPPLRAHRARSVREPNAASI
jgi:hypothetical protein